MAGAVLKICALLSYPYPHNSGVMLEVRETAMVCLGDCVRASFVWYVKCVFVVV